MFYRRWGKRALDLVLATLALVLLSPVLLILWIISLVKIGSPVLFRQKRPGQHGEIFEIMKLRSMRDDRDAEGNLLPDEVRLVPYGKFLRSSSLDELPGLFNVLRGEMSLVGPRPLLVKYLPLYNEEQMRRHDVRPGITGWAQVNGRNAISWDQKFAFDLYYVDNLSLGLDIKIMAMTVAKVFKRSGISAEGHATMPEFTGNNTE
jgi:lipopolysaccharide/colanic/teichoic acid biosynthesis glycosyltransferase